MTKRMQQKTKYTDVIYESQSTFCDKVDYGNGTIFLDGEIDIDTATIINRGLWTFSWDPDFEDDVTLIINSAGGSAMAGWSIVNTMWSVSNRVNTVGNGNVESMAIFLFAAGHKRSLYENTLCMIHHFSGEWSGNYLDLLAVQNSASIEYDRCLNHFKRVSKYKTEKKIRQYLLKDQDYFLTAQEMVEHGLCDEIIRV